MTGKMREDGKQIRRLLDQVVQEAVRFYEQVDSRPAALTPMGYVQEGLPMVGDGTMRVLERFRTEHAPGMSGSAGPRYLGFVTGGATPASLVGDWLVSLYDQNVTGLDESIAGQMELETIDMLKELFFLPEEFSGSFVTGATMANFVGLAQARQWAARQSGVDASQQGLYGLPPIRLASGAPHSSVYKALSMLGMGRQSMQLLPCLEHREAADLRHLRRFLQENEGSPCVIVANAGTVNTVDYDDLEAIAELKQEYRFWLHVDAAFGGFAACSPRYRHLVKGMEQADSLTIDAHKWLNVPYDSAMQFTRHKDLQTEVFQNNAAYLGKDIDEPEFIHLTPENSRRFRALPAWFTLKAYGRRGCREVVERNVEMARLLTEKLEQSGKFRLLAPTRLNVVCFTFAGDREDISSTRIRSFLTKVKEEGDAFLTPTVYQGVPGIRAAFSNWRTGEEDVERTWRALCRVRDTL